MPLLLVRHAWAGEREHWSGDDRLRPLDGRGRRQAEALVERLAPFRPGRILSSPFRRCVETVEPLARRLAIDVEAREELGEGSDPETALALLVGLGGDGVVCTHGDLAPALFGEPLPYGKGETWVLERSADGSLRPARSLPAP